MNTGKHKIANTLLDNTQNIVIGVSKTLIIRIFNQAAEKFFGTDAKKIVGTGLLEFFSANALEAPIGASYCKQPKHLSLTQSILRNGRTENILEWQIVPLFSRFNQLKNIVLIAELHDNNYSITKHVRQIIDCTPGSLYWKDKNGKYLGCNLFMVTTAGLNSVDDIVGKTDHELWPSSADKIRENDLEVFKTGETLVVNEVIKLADGEPLHFTGVKMPLKDHAGHIIGVIGNSLDITKLKQTEIAKESAEQANQIKTEFIRNMEHDIRTPFCGVLGMANILCERETDPIKKSALEDIANCAKELLDYCNNILDFSNIEARTIAVLEKKFDIQKLIESVITMGRPPAKVKNIDLLSDYDETMPTILQGDSYRVQSILINLVSNAIKFTKQGHVKLSTKFIGKGKDNTVIVRFIVEDTGIGIPNEKQNLIYEKFSRIMPSNRGIYKGQGLGLRIVKQFIEELNGEIDLKSNPEEGTFFICTVPFKLPLVSDIIES